MSLIKKPGDLFTEVQQVRMSMLIYGTPGVGKTTLALSSPKPLLIDFDNGISRVDVRHYVDTVSAASYKDLYDILSNKELIKDYDTIVIDTFGRMLEAIVNHFADDIMDRKDKSQISIRGYGVLKTKFQNIDREIRSSGKNVIYVAHTKKEKDGDRVRYVVDSVGSSDVELYKDLNCVGFMHTNGQKRTIDFMPNEQYYTKNSIGIDKSIEIPNASDQNKFLETKIFSAYAEREINKVKTRKNYDILIAGLRNNIEKLSCAEEVNNYYQNELNKHEAIWSSHLVEKQLLNDTVKKLGLSFNKETKLFV